MRQAVYPIVEIFQSIQGEGINMGKSATFIRFYGCNLRCPWCDTKYSWSACPDDMTQEQWQALKAKYPKPRTLTVAEILKEVSSAELVVLTGGEPTLYNLVPLVEALHKIHKWVAIETNGTFDFESLIADGADIPDTITISPKPLNGYHLAGRVFDELKYVVDENFQLSDIPDWVQGTGLIPIWLQPEGYHMEESVKRIVTMLQEPGAPSNLRMGIQMHKLLGVR